MTKKVRVAPNLAIAGRGGKSPALLVSSILNATRYYIISLIEIYLVVRVVNR
jgi:hypothetical protein